MDHEFYSKLISIVNTKQIRQNELLSCHTTFRIGGPADCFVIVQTAEQAAEILQLCRKEDKPYFWIGNGSNLLVSDRGYRGVVLQLSEKSGGLSVEKTPEGIRAIAGGGVRLGMLAREAAGYGAECFAFAAGIPGSVGGAVYMNAGAYDGEIKDTLQRVRLLLPDGTVCWKEKEELKFGYRSSMLQSREAVVLEAEFLFPEGEPQTAKQKIEEFAIARPS